MDMWELISELNDVDEEDKEKTLQDFAKEDERTRKELAQDFREHGGRDIFYECKSLTTSVYITQKNFESLEKIEKYYEENATDLSAVDSEPDLDSFFREYLRILHNYVSSVHSLISHTRTVNDRHEKEVPELKEKYEEEVNKRGLDTESEFLRQLRHYTQKYWLPPIATHTTYTQEGGPSVEHRLVLQRDRLLEWDGWNKHPREFLESLDEKIELVSFAEDYQRKLSEFYEWFQKCLLAAYHEEVRNWIITEYQLKHGIES